jgi:hypothetical protein
MAGAGSISSTLSRSMPWASTEDASDQQEGHSIGVVPERRATMFGQIDLPVTFGTHANFRTETLTFEASGFPGTYHTILGWPCYMKFMDIPNYTYLKLKMMGLVGSITMGTIVRHAYECEVKCCDLAEGATTK